jgi:hypothetical protein
VKSRILLPAGVVTPQEKDLVRGAVIGVVEIVDVIARSLSPWFSGPLGFVLRNPQLLACPVPCSGNAGIWDLHASIEKVVRESAARSFLSTKAKSAESEKACSHDRGKAYSADEIRRVYHQAYRPWTPEDDAYLRSEFLEGATIEDLVQAFARTPEETRSRLCRLGFDVPAGAGSEDLAVGPSSQESPPKPKPEWRAPRPNAGRVWTAADDELLLRELDAGVSVEEIAKRLGRGSFSVQVRLCKLGRNSGPK